MRHDWIGTESCRSHSKSLANPAQNKVYRGMAVLTADKIRRSGASIVDSRELFDGHADIKHGFVTTVGEPPSAEIVHAMRQRNKLLAKDANYYADPEPESELWAGPVLNQLERALN